MHQIDESFKAKKAEVTARRGAARRRKLLFTGAGGLLLSALVVAALTFDRWSFNPRDIPDDEIAGSSDDLVGERPVFVPAIVDLAGDPLVINIGRNPGELPKTREIPKPDNLMEPGISAQLTFLSDAMLSSSERFMTTLPSTPEDFAFFQAQRSIPQPSLPAVPLSSEVTQAVDVAARDGGDEPVLFDAAAGWGETVADGQAALPEFKKTRIENTTSIAFVTRESERYKPVEDIFVKVNAGRSLDSVALEHGFAQEDAGHAGEALLSLLDKEALQSGEVVALRGLREEPNSTFMKLMQVSIYSEDTYLGTLARSDEGGFVLGADPWVEDDLFSYSGAEEDEGLARQYRILDAIYSTAARNGVPTSVIGEAIMLLSRSHDLSTFATHDDRIVLLYSQTARDGNLGRVLYVAIHGAEKSFECFVYRPQSGSDFSCMSEDTRLLSQTILNGMVTPVNGVMKSTFGPRKHPILKTVRIHKGVDWAAPSGTPVFASYDGEVVFAGDGNGYGNLVRIKHSGGRETRYAHLDRFDPAAEPGSKVEAGDIIGYVGTTGLSTGPHLHFELYVGGEAVDPLQAAGAVASDGSAADILVDRIIRVESGGNAAAKNPLSTATGLGQFIDSTWLRMMRTYRPDLARSLSRDDQLALRFDPTLSREMVRHLAHEGEAYLRAHGHSITAGRLYLAHFLGVEGAHVVLSSAADAALADVLGQPVIDANPFLTGKDVAYVIGWAERKMRGRRGSEPVVEQRQVVRVSPEFERYRDAISELVAGMTEVL